MKLSNKEKVLVITLLGVLLLFGFYQFIYIKQLAELDDINMQIDDTRAAISALRSPEKTDEQLLQEIDEVAKLIDEKGVPFFPDIIQEKIIRLLNSDIQALDIEKVPLTFSSPTLVPLGTGDEENPENMALSMSVSTTFTCSYDTLVEFLDLVKSHPHYVVLEDINVRSASPKGDKVTCSLQMAFYAISKTLDKNDEAYMHWDLNDDYGVDNPFYNPNAKEETSTQNDTSGESSDSTPNDIVGGFVPPATTEATEEEPVHDDPVNIRDSAFDFFLTARPLDSSMAPVTIGRTNDAARKTYISSENQGIEKITITIDGNEAQGFYFSYGTLDKKYPASGTMEFDPKSDGKIRMGIYSTLRTDTSDVNGVELTIINNTDSNMEIVVFDEDALNPRVKINTVGNATFLA